MHYYYAGYLLLLGVDVTPKGGRVIKPASYSSSDLINSAHTGAEVAVVVVSKLGHQSRRKPAAKANLSFIGRAGSFETEWRGASGAIINCPGAGKYLWSAEAAAAALLSLWGGDFSSLLLFLAATVISV